jgi:hypothetical protein
VSWSPSSEATAPTSDGQEAEGPGVASRLVAGRSGKLGRLIAPSEELPQTVACGETCPNTRHDGPLWRGNQAEGKGSRPKGAGAHDRDERGRDEGPGGAMAGRTSSAAPVAGSLARLCRKGVTSSLMSVAKALALSTTKVPATRARCSPASLACDTPSRMRGTRRAPSTRSQASNATRPPLSETAPGLPPGEEVLNQLRRAVACQPEHERRAARDG